MILVVDDTPANIAVILGVLADGYRTKVATNGEKALALATGEERPDLILLDVMMPGLDGYEVCRRLKRTPMTADIPVIFLTAQTNVADEARGLELGAVDYIHKPFSPPVILARVRNHLLVKEAADVLMRRNETLEEKVQERTRQLSAIQDVTIMALASLAETRDNETGNHIRRTQHFVKLLATTLACRPSYQEVLTPDVVERLYKSAPLHDIGKVGIPDHILLKPGRLTDAEFAIMKGHAALGLQAIQSAETELGTPIEFLSMAKEIAYGHHEKWDGSGYPRGVAGLDIPLSARLMAIADVYDALISRRVYKEALSHEAAVAVIRDGRGTHFDPDLLDAFLTVQSDMRRIADRFVDPGTPAGRAPQDNEGLL
jgi:putative two-component system response regulator